MGSYDEVSSHQLLSREGFREAVLASNGGQCLQSCGESARDAHHILNRNLWQGEGEVGSYFLANGAGLCGDCHLWAELTLISCETLWVAKGGGRLLPAGWDASGSYDTWGNRVVDDYTRVRGPLFWDEGCQKALKAAGILYGVVWLDEVSAGRDDV